MEGDGFFSRLHHVGGDFAHELARVDGGDRLFLGGDGEGILIFAGDAILLGDVFRRNPRRKEDNFRTFARDSIAVETPGRKRKQN